MSFIDINILPENVLIQNSNGWTTIVGRWEK